ncbi:hypothetical protein SO802_012503, partial [Lithocarpus litseifolius]
MAANSQQFGTRLDLPSKHINEVVFLNNRKGSTVPIRARITRDGGITLILAMGIH